MFSIMAVPIYINSNSVGGFPFLHTLSSIYSLQIFNDGHSDWFEVISHCGFYLHFSNNFSHLMQRVDSLEKTLMLGGIWGRRRRGHRR